MRSLDKAHEKIEVAFVANYVDGFVLVVPKDKVEEYTKMASDAARIWKKHGALAYMECIGEDLHPQAMGGEAPLGFLEMAKASVDETVWYSFIIYESRAHRDQVNAKVMEEMNQATEQGKDVPMPFDMKRMAYGGFEVAVQA